MRGKSLSSTFATTTMFSSSTSLVTTIMSIALLSAALPSYPEHQQAVFNANSSISTSTRLTQEAFKDALAAPYVFTAFTESQSDLWVYTSGDATNFTLLKGPAYSPPTGVIRDPSVILHNE